MSSEPLTISVESLGKKYDIYAQPADRLKQMILPRVGRLIGKGPRAFFNEFWALRNVTFDVRRGETVGIIGRNGSGKSTLLQMVCSTLHPTEGAVQVYGRIAALLELGAGFNPEFTGKENVYLSGLLYGIPEGELRKRFQSIVDFADIGEFINQSVKTYSSGMYVRLAFAIAAHVDADTLVTLTLLGGSFGKATCELLCCAPPHAAARTATKPKAHRESCIRFSTKKTPGRANAPRGPFYRK